MLFFAAPIPSIIDSAPIPKWLLSMLEFTKYL